MPNPEPFDYIEIDVPRCSRVYGSSPCTARLGPNLLLRSEEFDNATWSKATVNGTVTADAAVGPVPGSVSDSYVENTATAGRAITQSVTVTSGTAYTLSCFAMMIPGSTRFLGLVLPTARFGVNVIASYTLSGAGSVNISSSGTNTSAGIVAIGGGWYRCWLKSDATSTGAGAVQVRVSNSSTNGAASYTGNGTAGLYLWGAQVNAGELGGYARTTSAAVTGASAGVRKCFNTKATCQDLANFAEGTPTTLRLCRPGPMPKNFAAIPAMLDASRSSTSVNIGGADKNLGQLGRRGTLSFQLQDVLGNERLVDPYYEERKVGLAQTNEAGYDPDRRGTFFAKLKARWPNYADANLRYIVGLLSGGALSGTTTTYFNLSKIDGPSQGNYACEAVDVLDLANGRKALAPRPSNGYLTADIGGADETFTIGPIGVGAEYAASGRVVIGSEIMDYTRSGDVLTVTRGVRGTTAAAHTLGDTVQQVLSYTRARVDDVAADLVLNYTDTPATWVDAAAWAAEVTRWASAIRLTTDIPYPTPVATLLSELGDLGCSIVPSETEQKLRLRMNRPVDGETVRQIEDAGLIMASQEDREADRITQVVFRHCRADPTKQLSDASNYRRNMLTVDPDAMTIYGGVRSREVVTRWLDQGDNTTAAIVSWRLIQRFRSAPKRVKIEVSSRDRGVALMDVIELSTTDLTDTTGNPSPTLMQVIRRSEPRAYRKVEIEVQPFHFEGRYGFITPNGWPTYSSATAEQKATGAFIVNSATLKFPDGTDPYKVI